MGKTVIWKSKRFCAENKYPQAADTTCLGKRALQIASKGKKSWKSKRFCAENKCPQAAVTTCLGKRALQIASKGKKISENKTVGRNVFQKIIGWKTYKDSSSWPWSEA